MLGHSALGQSALGQGARQSGGILDAIFAPAFVAAITGTVAITGAVDASFAPAFSAEIAGTVEVTGTLNASFAPAFVVEITGDSDGNIIVIPRDIADGIAYLLEIEAYDPVLEEVLTLTYSSGGFVSMPTDPIPNRVYDPHIDVPGDYSRSMFGSGGTSGEIQVGAGVVKLINIDSSLDALSDYAFDGRPLTIKTIARINPLYENAVTVFRGTMSHAEFKWGEVNLLIRDRLAMLDKPIQETLYAGTTVAGGMDEAEGQPEDLKGRPKPLPFGAPPNVQAVPSNVHDDIYDLGEGGLDAIAAVRDKGVLLTSFGTGYTSIADLRAATIPMSNWAGSLTLGKIRLASPPAGQVTASPVKGATAADRTAAQIARQIMLRMGLVEDVDFLASDVAALDALNDAEIGYWIGAEEQTALVAISRVLNSIGATCVPDRLGVFRLQRLDAPDPEAFPAATFTQDVILGGSQGVERLGTGDRGSGIRAWRVTINYGHNGAVMSAADLDPQQLDLTDAFRAFAGEEWRKAIAEDETVKVAHLLSPELTFDTYLIHEADAQAEAERRLALYGVPRERYRIEMKSFLAEPVDLNSIVELRVNRFRLSAGKNFRVIGIEENFETGNTTLDIWG